MDQAIRIFTSKSNILLEAVNFNLLAATRRRHILKLPKLGLVVLRKRTHFFCCGT
ncbi:hypothetical protein Fuma_05110 [Fuerstiella marisgermanici]|uniref:Uncharacterized protein n=1 Tax=Fuerstiella marisgermanici TaxID=1891926 RepID=A0A1P8WN04_9PLAN|nr:hypothetical protein Fuma_05110 [Fuerstiella marisgermanici]